MKPEPLFYVEREERVVAGPYDLVQMAGLLRRKIITPETMTRVEGEDGWKPFSWQPQFIVAREMSPDAVSTRVDRLDEEAKAAASGPIPLPSRETVLKLAGLVTGGFLAAGAAYGIARLDVTMGNCLFYAGIGAVLVATCMIWARILDEKFWTLALIFFVPFGDIYYFITRIWQYFPWFCVKYIGAAVAVGAAAGLAAHATH
jgi:GYF domain 2